MLSRRAADDLHPDTASERDSRDRVSPKQLPTKRGHVFLNREGIITKFLILAKAIHKYNEINK